MSTSIGSIIPYGAAIQDSIRSGDLQKMQAAAKAAEAHIAEFGNVPVALEMLRIEIAKLEHGK